MNQGRWLVALALLVGALSCRGEDVLLGTTLSDLRPASFDGMLPSSLDLERGRAPRSVLVLGAFPQPELVAALVGSGAFALVEDRVASSVQGDPSPTVAQLEKYESVLVNPTTHLSLGTGDALGDYWDRGGRVVLMAFASLFVRGRLMDGAQGYLAWKGTGLELATVSLGTSDTGHALMAGVTSLGSSRTMNGGGEEPGAIVVARWSTLTPAIVVRPMVRGTPRSRVDINFGSEPTNSSGDWLQLLVNALRY